MDNFTAADAARLRELLALDEDGADLSAEEYDELNDLLCRENLAFLNAA